MRFIIGIFCLRCWGCPCSESKNEKTLRRNLDSIVNKLLISRSTNRMLGDRYPHDYILKLIRDAKDSGTLMRKEESFRLACIPVNDLSIFDTTNFHRFIIARADLIIDEIKMIVGDSLVISETSDADDSDAE